MMKPEVTEVQPVIGTSGGTKDLFKGRDETLRTCIQNCLESHQRCEHMISHGLAGGRANAEQIRLFRDCSQACLMAADFMIRESAFHPAICRTCSEICAACAAMCDSFAGDDSMRQCADACRQSAESCRHTGEQEH